MRKIISKIFRIIALSITLPMVTPIMVIINYIKEVINIIKE